ncbi:MAG: LamG domain-containing protein [Verrucomicrobia bacterium]|nr:LamG domain-containing protein [Verrucomicrobiota bacterium]
MLRRGQRAGPDALTPWLLVELPGARTMRLCDFASAGAGGTRYRSWLPTTGSPPPPPIPRTPADGATVGSGKTAFRWTTKTNASLTAYKFALSGSSEFSKPLIELKGLQRPRLELDEAMKRQLKPSARYWWRVTAGGPHGETSSVEPAACFRFDPAQPPTVEEPDFVLGPGSLVVQASLRGEAKPEFGRLKRATAFAAAAGPAGSPNSAVRLSGQGQMLVYELPDEFEEDYSVAVWFHIVAFPEKRLGQVFSAWAGGMDDPLRLTVENGKLFARIEAQQVFSTKGVPIEAGKWQHVAAVKSGSRLSLFLNGQQQDIVTVPAFVNTRARSCALGGNPNYSGNEFLAADFAGFTMSLRALTPEEVMELAKPSAK